MCSASNKCAVALLIAAMTLPVGAQTLPPPARLEAAPDETGARFALRWPGRVATEVVRNGREVTLRFSRPLGAVALDGVPDRLAGWVDGVLYGYDSVLLVLAPGIAAAVVPDGSGVGVTFTAEPRATEDATDRAAQRRLDYFRALTLMEGGQVREARALLLDLLRSDPRDAQSTALLAQAEERLGRWRAALRAYGAALEMTPNEPSLVAGKARLLREHGDWARIDIDRQAVRGADAQRIARLSGVKDAGGSTAIAYTLESRKIDVDAAQRGDGTQAPFHGDRQRLDLAISHEWPELQRSSLALFAAERTLGAGYTHTWHDDESETRVGLVWSEPSFAFLEGILGGGRRDRVFVQRDERLSDRWNLTLGAGYNRYGLAGAEDLARSATVEASLRYTLNAEGPLVSVAYLLDAEYVGRKVERENAQAQPFAPLPAATREVHAIQLSVEDWLADYVRYAVQIGYAYDRRGKSGPQGAVSLGWEPVDALEIGFRASHARSTARGTASAVNAAGGYLMWRY